MNRKGLPWLDKRFLLNCYNYSWEIRMQYTVRHIKSGKNREVILQFNKLVKILHLTRISLLKHSNLETVPMLYYCCYYSYIWLRLLTFELVPGPVYELCSKYLFYISIFILTKISITLLVYMQNCLKSKICGTRNSWHF